MQPKNRITHALTQGKRADDEDRVLHAQVLAALPHETDDVTNGVAMALVQMRRQGRPIQNVEALARTVAKRRAIDTLRRSTTAKKYSAGEAVTAPESETIGVDQKDEIIARLKKDTRAGVARELGKKSWPARWRFVVAQMQTKCARCKGRCVDTTRPNNEWMSIVADGGTLLFPPACTACEGGGIGERPREEANSRLRKRARKTARERKARLWPKPDGKLEAVHARLAFEVIRHEPENWRQRLVKDLCSLATGERSPTARDLAIAALLAGDWPDAPIGTPANMVQAMAKTMRAVHRLLEKRGLVRPLAKSAP